MKEGKTGFVVSIVKPLFVPSHEGGFQREVKKVAAWASLDANTANDISLGSTRLIFQKEIMLEKWKVRVDGEIALA
jgi:hypothetical protein